MFVVQHATTAKEGMKLTNYTCMAESCAALLAGMSIGMAGRPATNHLCLNTLRIKACQSQSVTAKAVFLESDLIRHLALPIGEPYAKYQ